LSAAKGGGPKIAWGASREGGYAQHIVPFHALAVFEALSGVRTEVVDPFDAMLEALPYQELQPHQEAAIERAARRSPRPATGPAGPPPRGP
jgi:hypothetical protein